MNKVVLIGRLTRDPELKYTQSEKAVTSFSLAVTRPYNKDESDFINCTAWGKTAEIISQYVRKGHKLAVAGAITTGNYEKDGKTLYTTSVTVDSIEFLEKKNNDDMPF